MKKLFVVCIALAMVFAFTAEAMADMSAYGSVRFRTYTVAVDNPGATFDTRTTAWNMGILSRLGFNFSSGDVGGKWEFDTGIASVTSAASSVGWADTDSNRWGDLRVRHAYGYWNFGGGQLLIGQTFPLADLNAGVVYYTGNLDQGFGSIGLQTARPMQMRLTFGNFKVALISPYTTTMGVYTGATAVDATIPKIELGYTLKLENIALDFVGGYQTLEDRIVATDQSQDVDSYLLAARVKANFGAFFVNFVAGYAQNARQYGLEYTDNVTGTAVWNAASNTMNDCETINAALAIGFKISDTMTIQGGYGYTDSEADEFGGNKYEDTGFGYYVNLKVKLADNVYMIPEIVVIDGDDTTWGAATSTEQASTTAAGIFWVINFK